MRHFVVDVSTVTSWQEFISAFNRGFVHLVGGDWNGNLDALNDYLYWPDEHPYRLTIRGWSACKSSVCLQKTWEGREVLSEVADILQQSEYAQVEFVEDCC